MTKKSESVALSLDFLSQPYRYTSTNKIVPNALLSAWISSGPIFQAEYDIDSDDDYDDLIYWWFLHGSSTFVGINKILNDIFLEELYFSTFEDKTYNDYQLPYLLEVIIKRRQDLANHFDIKSVDGRKAFFKWWIFNGTGEIGLKNSLHDERLRDTFHTFSHCEKTNSFKWKSLLLNAFNVEEVENLDFEKFTTELHAKSEYTSRPDVLRILLSPKIKFSNNSMADKVPGMALHPYFARVDVQNVYKLDKPLGLKGYLEWYFENHLIYHNSETYDFFDVLVFNMNSNEKSIYNDTLKLLFYLEHNRFPSQSEMKKYGRLEFRNTLSSLVDEYIQHKGIQPAKDLDAAQVSIIGHAAGPFGLGEDFHLLNATFDLGGVETEKVGVTWTGKLSSNSETNVVSDQEANFASDTSIYCMPAFDTHTLMTTVGDKPFRSKRRIGFWQWELERLPLNTKICFDVITEIWCHSEYSKLSFESLNTDHKIFKVPLPVVVDHSALPDRQRFGLKSDDFVIGTSFDGASSIARKNPLAAIDAFTLAFPEQKYPNCRLMLKALNIKNDSLWNECLRRAVIDKRIVVLNEVLSKHDYYRYLKSCDVLISMHRSEGFGRLMAEGMCLGIPTVASAYSGNMDFMDDDNSYLVEGNLCDIVPGDYAHSAGMRWFEPSRESAAKNLLSVFEDRELVQNKINSARLKMKDYDLESCWNVYEKLLNTKT